MRYYFTSDLHLGHGKILEYCRRPFKTSDIMNQTLIRNWNMRVKPEDVILHIGDFCFRADKLTQEQLGGVGKEKANFWINQLNGQKIFIQGNHDKQGSLNTRLLGCLIEFGKERAYCVHKPEHINPNYPVNLTGHCHNAWRTALIENTLCINVGTDVWKYSPVSLDELLSLWGKFKANRLNIDRIYKSLEDYKLAISKRDYHKA